MYSRTEMLDLVLVNGHAKGIVVRDLVTGKISSHAADAVILATGGYGNVFFLSTNAMGCNVTAAWRAAKRGALFANPCFTQIHPTCIPVSGDYQSKLTLMSESLRNDGRIWVPKSKEVAEKLRKKQMNPNDVPEDQRDYYLERKYPSFGNLSPRDISSRAAKEACDDGRGIAPTGLGVYLDFRDATKRLGENVIRSRYGNLFQMYEKIAGEDPYKGPMMIYPAVHYTMGGLWVDYNLMSNVPGLHVLGEANFSDHGANRLGASALMQGLADGYFVIPTTIANYLVTQKPGTVTTDMPEFKQVETEARERVSKLFSIKGKRTVDSFHRELGMIMWDNCGMARSREGLDHGTRQNPANPRGILEQRAHPRLRRRRQHGTRKSRPRRRLPRIRRNDVLRRPRPRGILRRPLPHRTPVLRNRPGSPSPAAPRPVKPNATTTSSPTFPAGNTTATATPRSSTRKRSFTKASTPRSAATRERRRRSSGNTSTRSGGDTPFRPRQWQDDGWVSIRTPKLQGCFVGVLTTDFTDFRIHQTVFGNRFHNLFIIRVNPCNPWFNFCFRFQS